MFVVRSLDSTDSDEILRVLRDDGGYAMRVNGEQADSRTVASLLNDKPPEVGADDHHVVGLWVDDELAGVASFVVGWPSPDITYLGLLQLRTSHQGRGLARAFHQALRAEFPGRLRLTVVDTNAEVLPFWERLGYARTGETKEWTSDSGLRHEAVVMELPATRERPASFRPPLTS